MSMSTTTTVTRVATGKSDEAKSHKLHYVFPDGTSALTGGKVAARATHVVVVKGRQATEDDSEWYVEQRAGKWGYFAQNGRLDLAEKSAATARSYGAFEVVEVVEVVDEFNRGLL